MTAFELRLLELTYPAWQCRWVLLGALAVAFPVVVLGFVKMDGGAFMPGELR